MEYTIESTAANIVKITMGISAYPLTVIFKKVDYDVYTETGQTVTISPDVTPTTYTYILSGAAGVEWEATLPSDGVYKIYITENTVEHIHLFINTYTLDEYLKSVVGNILCCNPLDACHCGTLCDDYYDFNTLVLLSLTFFGEANIDIQLDYRTFTTEYLYKDYKYECKTVGVGPYMWSDAGTTLLQDSTGLSVTNNQPLTLGDIYSCVETGQPDTFGGATLSALTSDLTTRLNYTADAIYRYTKYMETCDVIRGCSC